MDEGERRAGGPLAGQIFYRYMSRAEAEAVLRTGFLRGSIPGETFFTEDRYESARQAKSRLALLRPPEVRVQFRMLSEPSLVRAGAKVEPKGGEPGGGTEWMTLEKVRVEVLDVDNLE